MDVYEKTQNNPEARTACDSEEIRDRATTVGGGGSRILAGRLPRAIKHPHTLNIDVY